MVPAAARPARPATTAALPCPVSATSTRDPFHAEPPAADTRPLHADPSGRPGAPARPERVPGATMAHLGELSWWVLSSALRSSWGHAAGSMALSLLMTALQAGSFVLVAKFAEAASVEQAVTLPLGLTIRPTAAGLLEVVAALLAGLGVAAACQYFARAVAVRAALRTERRATAEALRRIADARFTASGLPDGLDDDKTLIALVTRGPRYIGRALIEMLEALPALAAGLAATAYLGFTDPIFTLGVVVLAAFTLPAHLVVIRKGMQSGRDLVEHARADAVEKVGVLNALRRRPVVAPDESDWLDDAIAGETAQRHMRAYSLRLRVSHLSLAVSNVAAALVVAGLVFYFGRSLLEPGSTSHAGISGLLVYLIALKMMMGGLGSVVKAFTSINIFYVFFDRNLALLNLPALPDRAAPDPAPPHPAPPAAHPERAPTDGRHAPSPIWPGPGEVLVVVARPAVTLLNVAGLWRALLRCSDEHAAGLVAATGFVSGAFADVADEPARCFALPAGFSTDAFVRRWPVFARRVKPLRDIELGRRPGPPTNPAGPAARFVLSLAAVLARPECRLVLVDGPLLAGLKPAEVQALWDALADRTVVLVFASPLKRWSFARHGPVVGYVRGQVVFAGRTERVAAELPALASALRSGTGRRDAAAAALDAVDDL